MLNEKKLTTKQRANLSASDFGIPELRAYPLNDRAHVIQAIRLFNNVDPNHEATLANNLIKAIKRFNLDVTVGENNRFKKYYEGVFMKKISPIVESIVAGKDVRSALLEENADFEKNAEKFKSYLTSHYGFVKSVDLEIDQYTAHVSNFFIRVYTTLSEIFPEESVAKYNLEKVVTGSTIHYGIGGPEETRIESNDLAQSVSNLFYADAEKCGLTPVVEHNSYSIMKYNHDSYYYRCDRDSDFNMILRLEFYTDRGLADK